MGQKMYLEKESFPNLRKETEIQRPEVQRPLQNKPKEAHPKILRINMAENTDKGRILKPVGKERLGGSVR